MIIAPQCVIRRAKGFAFLDLAYVKRGLLYRRWTLAVATGTNSTVINIERQILLMSEAELDGLPQGIIRLDRTGKILYYNRAEAELAHRTGVTSVGLNFFRDVAPCTDVKDFHGRFNDFLEKPGSRIEPFTFLFRFGWGNKEVNITLVRRSGAEESIYVVVSFTK